MKILQPQEVAALNGVPTHDDGTPYRFTLTLPMEPAVEAYADTCFELLEVVKHLLPAEVRELEGLQFTDGTDEASRDINFNALVTLAEALASTLQVGANEDAMADGTLELDPTKHDNVQYGEILNWTVNPFRKNEVVMPLGGVWEEDFPLYVVDAHYAPFAGDENHEEGIFPIPEGVTVISAQSDAHLLRSLHAAGEIHFAEFDSMSDAALV